MSLGDVVLENMNYETIDLWRKFSNFITLGDITILGTISLYDGVSNFPTGSCCSLSIWKFIDLM